MKLGYGAAGFGYGAAGVGYWRAWRWVLAPLALGIGAAGLGYSCRLRWALLGETLQDAAATGPPGPEQAEKPLELAELAGSRQERRLPSVTS